MNEKNGSLTILVDDRLSELNLKIKRLKEVDDDKHTYEIQFLEYLQNNFIRLGDFQNQIFNLTFYYKNEIRSNWDHLTDQKFELEKRKQEVKTLKQQITSTQIKEANFQNKKKKLSRQLKKQELNLIRNQKRFNESADRLDKLYSKMEILSKLKKKPKDTFLNKLFESRNKFQAKRFSRLISERQVEFNDLSELIPARQEQITEMSQEIEYQQKQLKELQIKNINLRNSVHKLLKSIKETKVEIQQTENQIDANKSILKEVFLALVEIANETSRQDSLYQKSCLASLDDIEYDNLLQEAIFSRMVSKDVEELLTSENFLSDSPDTGS